LNQRAGLRKTLATRFDEELRFFKGWIDKPKAVGSIVPTSSITSRKMASVIDPHSGLPVLELGPGTGVITKAILARGVAPENLYTVEYSEDFVQHLRRHYRAPTGEWRRWGGVADLIRDLRRYLRLSRTRSAPTGEECRASR